MPLRELPVEIICAIIRFIGSEELCREKSRCLLVSKWWHRLAEPILFEDLLLSANNFLKLPESAQVQLTRFARRLEIFANEKYDWPYDTYEPGRLDEHFKALLSHGTRLQSFSLRTSKHFDQNTQPWTGHCHYLFRWSPAHGTHICPDLASKLPCLRSLRLRTYKVCPRVFEIPHNSAIESIIVNLSLVETHTFSAGFSKYCDESKSASDGLGNMLSAAAETAKRMSSLKKLRVLRHKHPTLDMSVYDCVTGDQMILHEEEEWDWSDDGQLDPLTKENSDQEFSSDTSDGSDNDEANPIDLIQ
ncbi:F-box protein [Aspergillus stella-maris]|uniref:F-box protein n=1 Tax=Aspergillus stella-maris TaxID=1810926 RepID=UPI003CCE288A